MKLLEWQEPLAARQTEVLKRERCFLMAAHTGCLAAGTPVRMFDGSIKPVEDVRPGDTVESFDEVTGIIYPNKVLDNIKTCHKPKPMIQCTHGNETIKTTYDHYFFVDGGFVPLYQLAWRAMETSQRSQLKLLCERYGSPLDLGAPWWKSARDNEARKGPQWILPNRTGCENGESPSYSRGELAVEPVETSLRESYKLRPSRQQSRKPGMVFDEVQCVVWRAPWEHTCSAPSETGSCIRASAGQGSGSGEGVSFTRSKKPKRNPAACERTRVGTSLRDSGAKVPGVVEGQAPDDEKLATGAEISFRTLEAEPYFTISLEKAPYAYCIGNRYRFPVHNSGKTYLAAQTIKDLELPTIVVAPKISLTQWTKVLEGMGAMPYVRAVVNPEKLVASKKQKLYDHDLGWSTDAKLLVWDETHRGASGEKSKSTKALARWCNKAHPDNKALLMSATPADSPMKMRALGYLMGFHRFVDASWYDFLRKNGCFISNRGGRGHLEFTKDRLRATAIMKRLRADMGDRFMSVGPGEIPGFPDEVREVELVDLEKKDHDALVEAYAEMPELMKKPSSDSMVKLLRLRQQAEFCKASVLAEMAMDEVTAGNSVFIAISFTDCRLRIQTELERNGIPFSAVYGGQKESERKAMVDGFQQNRVHVMIGMMQACGVALSLHDEKHERPRVSLISPSFSASDVVQALGRIRRVGGTPVVQRFVLVANSVEERVAKTIRAKLDALSSLTDTDLLASVDGSII